MTSMSPISRKIIVLGDDGSGKTSLILRFNGVYFELVSKDESKLPNRFKKLMNFSVDMSA